MTVGSLGFVLQAGALAILTAVAHWPWLPATIVAVQLAVVHNFLWHQRWTWRDRVSAAEGTAGAHRRERRITSPEALAAVVRFIKFDVTTGLTSTAGNVALMAVLVNLIGLPPVAANAAAVAAMSVLNFAVSDRWVFQDGGLRDFSSSVVRRPTLGGALPPLRSFTVVVAVALAASAPSAAAAPSPETLAAWDRYVAAAEARIARRTASALSTEGVRPDARRGASGEPIQPTPALARCAPQIGCEGEGVSIPSGTINRWHGSVFLPGISLDQLLHRLQYPGTPPPQEDVAESRLLARTPDGLRVHIRLVRSAIVTVTYDTEHDMRFQRLSPTLATARSAATRIQQVGGSDHGFLWRLNSYWRYQQNGDGVDVELESLTLSRHVPALVRPIAAPVVTQIARESLVRTLEALRRYMAPPPPPRTVAPAGPV